MAAKRSKRRPTQTSSTADFVLDSSTVLAWLFRDEASAYADRVARSLVNRAALVPGLWLLEVANAILVAERRGRCSVEESATFVAHLAAIPIRYEESTPALTWASVLPLARSERLSAYDAEYLALALRHGLPLATLDKSLQKSATSVGVPLYSPA